MKNQLHQNPGKAAEPQDTDSYPQRSRVARALCCRSNQEKERQGSYSSGPGQQIIHKQSRGKDSFIFFLKSELRRRRERQSALHLLARSLVAAMGSAGPRRSHKLHPGLPRVARAQTLGQPSTAFPRSLAGSRTGK